MSAVRRGFTLIEIMVATTLFALLMGTYYMALSNVLLLEEHARDQRAFGSIAPSVLDLIEDDFLSLHAHPRERAVFPFRAEDASLGSEAADRVDFVALRESIRQEEFFGHDRWVRSPVNEVGYRLARPADGGRREVRTLHRREGYYVDGTPLQGGDYYEVYDGVVAFDIYYLGYRVEEEARAAENTSEKKRLEKFESWDSEERKGLPTAAVVTLTIAPPRMQATEEDERTTALESRTFVRIIPFLRADDVEAPAAAAAPGTPPQPPPNR